MPFVKLRRFGELTVFHTGAPVKYVQGQTYEMSEQLWQWAKDQKDVSGQPYFDLVSPQTTQTVTPEVSAREVPVQAQAQHLTPVWESASDKGKAQVVAERKKK